MDIRTHTANLFLPLVLLLPKTRIRCTKIITNMPFLMTVYPTFDYFSTKRSLGVNLYITPIY